MHSMPPTAPAAASSPAALSPLSATEALYRAALGPGKEAHYLPLFARFDEDGVARPVWNPAAAWLNLNWLLYRRLWRPALLQALAVATLLGAWHAGQQLLGPWPMGVRWGLLAFIGLLAVAVPGLWGTAWLHADVRRRMTAAVRQARTVQEACDRLQRPTAARHVWRVALALQLVAAAALVGVAGLNWPPRAGPGALQHAVPTDSPVASSPAATALSEAPPPAAAPVTAPPTPSTTASTAALAEPLPPEPILRTPERAPQDEAGEPRPRLQGHGVNVGMFADPANAERVRSRLSAAGLPVVTDTVESARGPLTRVRVGPFEQAGQAGQAAQTVRNLGLDAQVFGP